MQLRILAVDDQEMMLDVLQQTLEADGHTVYTTVSGAAGVTLAEQQRPHVILLDINMPDMDGMQVLQVLKQSPVTAGIPVIVLSGDRDMKKLRDAFQLGASDYIAKPFQTVELRARILHLAQLKLATDRVHYLQEVNRLKEDFIAVLSHELRTPLTVVMGFTEMLLGGMGGPLNVQQEEYLEIIRQRSGALHELIEELLEFNLLKAGQRQLQPAPVSLLRVLQQQIDKARLALEAGGLHIELRVTDVEHQMVLDARALGKLVAILLSNAIKFTPHGGMITLAAEVSAQRLTLKVQDNGIGIPLDLLPVVFESFRQLEAHRSRRYNGLGLGLSIAKQLVELHGGRLWAESEEGKGSTFTVVLPQQADERVSMHWLEQPEAASAPASQQLT